MAFAVGCRSNIVSAQILILLGANVGALGDALFNGNQMLFDIALLSQRLAVAFPLGLNFFLKF